MNHIGTVALRGMVPALLLAPVVVAAAIVGGLLHPSAGDFGAGIFPLIVAVFAFVLLGSMTLNAWLLLRHPSTFSTRALSERVAALQVALWAVLAVWAVLLLVGVLDVVGIALAVAAMLLSIVVFALALARRRDAAARVSGLALSGGVRAAALVYLVAAVAALLFAIASSFIGTGWTDAAGAVGGPATLALLLLGLPWSYLPYVVVVVVQLSLGISLTVVNPLVVALAVVADIVLVSVLLWSPGRRDRLVNWFFRLGFPGAQGVSGG